MQRIYPSVGPDVDDLDALAELYAYPSPVPSAGWWRAMMVSSLDGAAQGPDGRSGSLSSAADQRVFALTRGLADLVVVGAGTVRAEGYGPADVVPEFADLRRRARQLPAPAVAVVSRALDLDPEAPLFTAPPRRTIVVTVASAPARRRAALAENADVVVAGDDRLDVVAARTALAERGYRRVVCEGGPHLLSHIAAADEVDELCCTFAPVLVGSDALRLLDGGPVPGRPWQLAHIIEDSGTLLTRWVAGRHATRAD